MTMFIVEWLDAPGVRDEVLAATWARLEVRVGGDSVVELIDLVSDSRRTAVYGSVFPLVEWFVENWWAVLHEPSPRTPLVGARRVGSTSSEWMSRHNLLAAREGGAFPDLTIVADGDEIVLHAEPDAAASGNGRVRFLGDGERRIARATFEDSVRRLIEATLLRAQLKIPENEDVERVKANWCEIEATTGDARALCRGLAMLGLDPYSPDPEVDEAARLVEHTLATMPSALADDLLESGAAERLSAGLKWVERVGRTKLSSDAGHREWRTLSFAWDKSAHETGYCLARRVRTELLALAPDVPLADLAGQLGTLGWSAGTTVSATPELAVEGMIGVSRETGAPQLVTPEIRGEASERFRLARSLFFMASGAVYGGPRLLTHAVTRSQRAARAFAAELLAPSAGLAKRVVSDLSEAEVDTLAEEFRVHPLVIEHQVQNHGLARVRAL